MGKSNIGIFLFLLLCSGCLFTFSQLGPLAYDQVFGEPRAYEAETMVGSTSIGGLTKTEARQKLSEEVMNWKKTHTVTLEMKDQNVVFQQDFIRFDIPATLNQVENGTNNYLKVDLNESYFSVLQNKIGTDLYNHILIDKLSEKILVKAEALHNEPLHFSIYQYVEDGTTELYEVVSEYSIEVNADLHKSLVQKLNGAPIPKQTPFSLLSFVEEGTNQQALNVIATAIYGAVLNTNFIINQRHISTELPPYAELGRESSVQKKHNHDLVFTNPNEQAYQLNISEVKNRLTVKILGYPLPNSYDISLENSRKIQPRTIIQFSELIPPGQPKVKAEGKEGTSVEVYRLIEDEGKVIQKDLISDDYYPPVNRVEIRYGTNDQPSEMETNPRNDSGRLSESNVSNSSQMPNAREGNQTKNSNASSSTSRGVGESEPDNRAERNSSDDGEALTSDNVWEKPQGNTKSKGK